MVVLSRVSLRTDSGWVLFGIFAIHNRLQKPVNKPEL